MTYAKLALVESEPLSDINISGQYKLSRIEPIYIVHILR